MTEDKLTCPGCGEVLDLTDDQTEAECPGCGAPLTVTEEGSQESPAGVAAETSESGGLPGVPGSATLRAKYGRVTAFLRKEKERSLNVARDAPDLRQTAKKSAESYGEALRWVILAQETILGESVRLARLETELNRTERNRAKAARGWDRMQGEYERVSKELVELRETREREKKVLDDYVDREYDLKEELTGVGEQELAAEMQKKIEGGDA